MVPRSKADSVDGSTSPVGLALNARASGVTAATEQSLGFGSRTETREHHVRLFNEERGDRNGVLGSLAMYDRRSCSGQFRQSIVRIVVIDGGRRNQFVFDEYGGGNLTLVQDVEADANKAFTVSLGEIGNRANQASVWLAELRS